MELEIDLEKLRPLIEDGVSDGPAAAARKHNLAKSNIAGLLSASRKVGAIPTSARGRVREYDPAAVVAALAVKPLGVVSAEFNLSAGTLVRIEADFKKSQKSSPSSAVAGAEVQASA